MKYQVYPDGTIGIIKPSITKKGGDQNVSRLEEKKKKFKHMNKYDDHKLFK